jgi:hypothetical protein
VVPNNIESLSCYYENSLKDRSALEPSNNYFILCTKKNEAILQIQINMIVLRFVFDLRSEGAASDDMATADAVILSAHEDGVHDVSALKREG